MNPVKIVFFDIDGTLVDPATGCISPKTKEALIRLHQKGILLCIATGRPPASLPDLTGLPFDGFITVNGSLCYSGETVIFHKPFSPEALEKVVRNAAALGLPVSAAGRHRLAANGWGRDLADYYRLAGLELTVAEDFDEFSRQDIYQIMVGCRKEDHAAILRGAEGVDLTYSWDRAVDIIPAGNSKAEAITKILAYYALEASQAMAFGDGFNDLQMLQVVGTGVAMGNAAPELKAIADHVCGPVGEDGIYSYCIEQGLI